MSFFFLNVNIFYEKILVHAPWNQLNLSCHRTTYINTFVSGKSRNSGNSHSYDGFQSNPLLSPRYSGVMVSQQDNLLYMTCEKLPNSCSHTRQFAVFTLSDWQWSADMFVPAHHEDEHLSFSRQHKPWSIIRFKRELSFIITSTKRKYLTMWNWTHEISHAQSGCYQKGGKV